MRVLVVPKWYPWPDRPVLGIFCREHARALATRHDVVVLASDAVRSPEFTAVTITDGVEAGLRTIRLRYRRPFFRPAAMAFQVAGMVLALRRLRREGWRADVIHAHVYSAGIPALVLGRLTGAPVVITEHYTGFQRNLITGYDRFVARIAFKRASLVAPVSRDLAGYIRPLASRTRIEVVPNVVDTAAFHPGRSSPPDGGTGHPRLLTVAALADKKGHAVLLEALAILRREHPELGEATLDLVGGGEEDARLRAQTQRLDLDANIHFRGELPKEQVAELMRQADLFVLPSHFENLPVVLLEAMATGLPFVATAVGGVPELLEGQPEAGVLCPPGDPAALAFAIADALHSERHPDPQRLAEQAGARFGYEAFAERWTELYAGLSAARNPQASTGARAEVRRLRRDIRFLRALRLLPLEVARFQWRAWRMAGRADDEFARVAATRPRKLATLLALAEGRRSVVELGTAQAWTAISLALSDPARQVTSYDNVERPGAARYLDLVAPEVRRRVRLIVASADRGPESSRPVELLYIDTSHERDDTIRELEAWRPALADGAVVVFDDFDHPEFPGVRQAVTELRLDGEERDGLFVHRVHGVS